ncbi:MAG: type 4a pilus biogenesis protein PilO [Candidatus Muirbacterium halophilum]|nr:type 4a pilus biogenesis protein PilO [Candidatus Muirbacterium halophilum]MCK9475011.1 type 4a pilus biogenesis protein PilO [Candidatus Muirbacterium halophilum]
MSIRMKSILEKFAVYIILFILIISNLFLALNIGSIKDNAKNKSNEISSNNNKFFSLNQQYQKKLELVDVRKKEQEELLEKTNLFKKYFITVDEIPLIMADIQKIADKSGVDVNSFNYNPLEDNIVIDFIKMEFFININGSYKNVKKFFWELEHLRWVLKQSDISIEKLFDNIKKKENITLSIKLFNFVRKEVKTVKKI